MRELRNLPFCILLCFFLAVTSLSAQTLQIVDSEGHATTLSPIQISNLPHVVVKVLDHDAPAQFEGVSLASLLSTAGVQLGDKLRGPRMTEVLLVEAADRYRVVFALAEVDPAAEEELWCSEGLTGYAEVTALLSELLTILESVAIRRGYGRPLSERKILCIPD